VEEAADPVAAVGAVQPFSLPHRQRVPQLLLQHLEKISSTATSRGLAAGRTALHSPRGASGCGTTHLLAHSQPLLPLAELHGVLLVQPPQLPPLLLCQEVHLLALAEERWKWEGRCSRRGSRGAGSFMVPGTCICSSSARFSACFHWSSCSCCVCCSCCCCASARCRFSSCCRNCHGGQPPSPSPSPQSHRLQLFRYLPQTLLGNLVGPREVPVPAWPSPSAWPPPSAWPRQPPGPSGSP